MLDFPDFPKASLPNHVDVFIVVFLHEFLSESNTVGFPQKISTKFLGFFIFVEISLFSESFIFG